MEQNVFNFIRQELPLHKIVGHYLTLLFDKGLIFGRCPFSKHGHTICIDQDNNIFRCQECKTGGDWVSFVCKIEDCSQYDAVDIIVKRHGITLPYRFSGEYISWKKNLEKEYDEIRKEVPMFRDPDK